MCLGTSAGGFRISSWKMSKREPSKNRNMLIRPRAGFTVSRRPETLADVWRNYTFRFVARFCVFLLMAGLMWPAEGAECGSPGPKMRSLPPALSGTPAYDRPLPVPSLLLHLTASECFCSESNESSAGNPAKIPATLERESDSRARCVG